MGERQQRKKRKRRKPREPEFVDDIVEDWQALPAHSDDWDRFDARDEAAIFREGNTLCVPDGGALPHRCVRCNAATRLRFRQTLSWAPGVVIPGFIQLTILIRLVYGRSATVTMGLCRAHHREWRRCMLLFLSSLSLPVGAIAGAFLRVWDGGVALAGFFGPLLVCLWLLKLSRVVETVGVGQGYARFVPGRPFLESFADEELE